MESATDNRGCGIHHATQYYHLYASLFRRSRSSQHLRCTKHFLLIEAAARNTSFLSKKQHLRATHSTIPGVLIRRLSVRIIYVADNPYLRGLS